jgi:hypothetical protein
MNTLELLSAVRSNSLLKKHCVGVFSADKIPLPLLPSQACIINTDTSSETGKHWILLFQSSNDELEFFCSYGMSPIFYQPTWSSLFYATNSSVLYNTYQVQNIYSNTCGLHCLFCLYYRCINISFPTILTEFYKPNTCFNDRCVSKTVADIVNYKIIFELTEPIQVCNRMFEVVQMKK